MNQKKVTHSLFLFIVPLLMCTAGYSQNYYRTVASGAWGSLATWEFSTNLTTWAAATAIPGKAADSIIIQSGHAISLNQAILLDQLQVLGTLTLQNGALVTYGDNPGTDYLTGPGEIIVESGGSLSMEAETSVITNMNMTIEEGGSVSYAGANTQSIATPGNARTIDISGEFNINSRVAFEGSLTLNILTTGVLKIAEFNVPVTEINFSDNLGAGTTTNFFNLGLVEIGNRALQALQVLILWEAAIQTLLITCLAARCISSPIQGLPLSCLSEIRALWRLMTQPFFIFQVNSLIIQEAAQLSAMAHCK